MKHVTVIGKNSFMARLIREKNIGKDWLWLSHNEAMDSDEWLDNTRCVINFSYAPDLRKNKYNAALDIDTKLAKRIQASDIHYIMLSSRMVYGTQDTPLLTESLTPNPQNIYGANKHQIEQNLIEILGQPRVTILRLSNVFGFEPNRASFFGMALTKLAQENCITYDMSPFTKRDFLSTWRFGQDLEYIAQRPTGGIFNLGSGIGLETGRIAQWLIDGYGKGSLLIKDMSIRDIFWLNMQKTRDCFRLPDYTLHDLQQDCTLCGTLMKDYHGE
ncbi:MAG: hypothetical protein COB14_05220 [Alphaproteobacteria bacterium]|nr:MAG: hypothetical protein COB14_05220 [Alphaproteobacteria bacterium]